MNCEICIPSIWIIKQENEHIHWFHLTFFWIYSIMRWKVVIHFETNWGFHFMTKWHESGIARISKWFVLVSYLSLPASISLHSYNVSLSILYLKCLSLSIRQLSYSYTVTSTSPSSLLVSPVNSLRIFTT